MYGSTTHTPYRTQQKVPFLHNNFFSKLLDDQSTMENQASNLQTPHKKHVVIVPSPGMGHLIPLTEFAKLLHINHHFSISILLPSSTPPTAAQTAYLTTLPPSVSYTFLPQVDSALLPPNVAHEVTITLTHRHSISALRDSIVSLTRHTRVVALVTDLFGTLTFDVARECGIPPYLYFTSSAMCLSLLLHLPMLDETVSCEYRDMKEPVVLPGCVPLHGKDFVDPAQDRKDEAYTVILDQVKRYHLAEGIIINTFMDLEPDTVRGLKNEFPTLPPVYPVGPIIQSGLGVGSDESDCLSWLKRQPPGSVLFVSFGSGGTLSYEQLNELAIGLEKCGQRFIWVVRSPSNISYGSYLSGYSEDDPFGFLPNGFVERIKDRGLLVPSWAPQIKVLGHESTGGFLTHCGWNSILEGVINGIPLIAWPLYAEQKMNAVMLNEGIKVALRPKPNENGIVEAEEIANVVKELMEGEEGKKIRHRMKELSDSARRARSDDGDSTKLLNKVALDWCQSKV